jgi:hypothetical protein
MAVVTFPASESHPLAPSQFLADHVLQAKAIFGFYSEGMAVKTPKTQRTQDEFTV